MAKKKREQPKQVKILKTKTYKKSLGKFNDPKVILTIENKIDKLLDNPALAIAMKYQHSGYCEILVGNKYGVYGIKEDEDIILIVLALALHHKKTYKKSKDYKKVFKQLEKIKQELKIFKEKNKHNFIDKLNSAFS